MTSSGPVFETRQRNIRSKRVEVSSSHSRVDPNEGSSRDPVVSIIFVSLVAGKVIVY